MANVRIKLNNSAFYELRNSTAVVSAVNEQAARIAQAATAASGQPYSWESHAGAKSPQGRWRATVWPDSVGAIRNEQRNDTLLSILGGSGTW